ncbi:hypothetical protein I4I73_04320 [Pseudonocardia sp. KRD-184]|uniref:Uncharacterized protein n=1 Tax=Pseudonocardia oceani TaxID=2792013 RepID=A0ABS6UAK0_9PSEU|nr:hypothetical protein [Pseudonocardia oceani]MBW0089748.1 hypothetical protein [Pseudonocardia oceani]MBW0095224.1 hypothetical protein [Pseudonocardia oceani]MBW0107728.1 hypothetical protein [Pseudonocardia oceani]MBW0121719.1 hypothetical protein [Pseudonocardia oceani]MBW0129184.1 hypothetical protein [Pseudonocardia oceani]
MITATSSRRSVRPNAAMQSSVPFAEAPAAMALAQPAVVAVLRGVADDLAAAYREPDERGVGDVEVYEQRRARPIPR